MSFRDLLKTKKVWIISGIVLVLGILICVLLLTSCFFNNGEKQNAETIPSEAVSIETASNVPASTEPSSETVATGEVQGTVYDNGVPLADAKVTLISAQEHIENATESDADGHFQFILSSGTYTIEISCEGYELYTGSVSVNPNEVTELKDCQLVPLVDYEEIYFTYVQEVLQPKYGLAGMNHFSMESDGAFGSLFYLPKQVQGLVSAEIGDYTEDGNVDLLTVVFTQSEENYIWKIQLHSYQNEEITRIAVYDFCIDKHANCSKLVQIEALPGHIAISSVYCKYEGLTSEYVFLNHRTLQPELTLHLYGHGGTILKINQTDELSAESVRQLDTSIEKALNQCKIGHTINKDKECLSFELSDSRILTDYLIKDDVIVPHDATGLRERLGISYSTSFIQTIVPVAETTEVPFDICDTLHYDVDNDGYIEEVKVGYYSDYQNELIYRVLQEDAAAEEYSFWSANSLVADCIIYDANIGQTYIGSISTSGGATSSTFIMEGKNRSASVVAYRTLTEEGLFEPVYYNIGYDYVSMEEARKYLENLTILYSYRDPAELTLKEGLEWYFIETEEIPSETETFVEETVWNDIMEQTTEISNADALE